MIVADLPKRILAITAHPDDADGHAGGTVACWVEEGHAIAWEAFKRRPSGFKMRRHR